MTAQRLLGYVRCACDTYGMIQEGDRIAVGVSGGKDSLALLYALSRMRDFYPRRYEVCGITVSLGLPGFDPAPVRGFCEGLGVEYRVLETNIGRLVFEERAEKNPCSLCARLRRGALNRAALAMGCNKTALGHNRDDIIQTLFMALFYEGRIYAFPPVTRLDRTGLTALRPLILAPERDVASFAKRQGLPVIESPCPAAGKTAREGMRRFIRDQRRVYSGFEAKVFGAIRRSNIEGWGRQIIKEPPGNKPGG